MISLFIQLFEQEIKNKTTKILSLSSSHSQGVSEFCGLCLPDVLLIALQSSPHPLQQSLHVSPCQEAHHLNSPLTTTISLPHAARSNLQISFLFSSIKPCQGPPIPSGWIPRSLAIQWRQWHDHCQPPHLPPPISSHTYCLSLSEVHEVLLMLTFCSLALCLFPHLHPSHPFLTSSYTCFSSSRWETSSSEVLLLGCFDTWHCAVFFKFISYFPDQSAFSVKMEAGPYWTVCFQPLPQRRRKLYIAQENDRDPCMCISLAPCRT